MRFAIKITDNFLLEPVLHTFGVKNETSFADITEGALVVKMGSWFEHAFPLTEIARLAPSDWPWWGGLGVKLAHHGVGVVGSSENIVNVRLRAPQKVRVIFTVECEQIWLSLVDPAGFLEALSAATSLPVAPHTPF